MPIYEYECETCNDNFEQFRSISDRNNDAECPRCGKKSDKIVISSFMTGCSNGSCNARVPT